MILMRHWIIWRGRDAPLGKIRDYATSTDGFKLIHGFFIVYGIDIYEESVVFYYFYYFR